MAGILIMKYVISEQESFDTLQRVIKSSRETLKRQLLETLNKQVSKVCITMPLSSVIPRPIRERRMWMKNRSGIWWDMTSVSEDDDIYKASFRMTKRTFLILCNKLQPYLPRCGRHVRKPIPVEKKIAIALYKLASCAEYRVVGDVFGVHKASVHNFLHQ